MYNACTRTPFRIQPPFPCSGISEQGMDSRIDAALAEGYDPAAMFGYRKFRNPAPAIPPSSLVPLALHHHPRGGRRPSAAGLHDA